MAGIKLGFNFIPFPQAIVDDGIDLSLSEYRLLGYLLRHQLRLGKSVIKLKQDELINGRLLPDGSRCDRGSGLVSGRDVKLARESLAARGWIAFQDTAEGMLYEIRLDEDRKVQNVTLEENPKLQNVTSKVTKCHPQSNNLSLLLKEEEGQEKVIRKTLPTSPQGSVADSRIGDFKKLLTELVVKKTSCAPGEVEWSGREAAWLKRKLQSQTQWSWKFLEFCLRNWADSETNHRKPFWLWKDELSSYAGGPLNEYGKRLKRAAATQDYPDAFEEMEAQKRERAAR